MKIVDYLGSKGVGTSVQSAKESNAFAKEGTLYYSAEEKNLPDAA